MPFCQALSSQGKVFNFSESSPLVLKPKIEGTNDSPADFVYYSIAPVLGNGWTLLGEQSKWVPLSAKPAPLLGRVASEFARSPAETRRPTGREAA